jgi:ATP-dependent RNA helicase DDX55/SPB4
VFCFVDLQDAYIDFLNTRKVPTISQPPYTNISNATLDIRNIACAERDVFEKGQRAFVSYVRAYKEHHCQFIFRMSSLNLGHLATCMGLALLPKMPETKDKKFDFEPANVKGHEIKFTDKVREQHRLEKLQKRQEEWEASKEGQFVDRTCCCLSW